jgi:hypothetical protein
MPWRPTEAAAAQRCSVDYKWQLSLTAVTPQLCKCGQHL